MSNKKWWISAIVLTMFLSLAPQIGHNALPIFADSNADSVPSLAPMIKRVSPAVVNIAVSGSVEVTAFNPFRDDPFFRHFFDFPEELNRREFQSAGSGVIVNAKDGIILTNHHVVDNADRITVTLLDERTLEAEVIGSDKDTDIAVIQVDAEDLTDIRLADSDLIEVGDYVVAIGNPFGFGHSVTAGIVSALGRSGINRDAYEDFIQTDAPINPGNSGGALINLRGELVGINSAIISRSGGNLGIGFAIPINMASSIMQQLLTHGEVKRGLLGVKIHSVTPEIAEAWGLDNDNGALIAEVTPGSAADKAGLQAGDVVIAVNGQKITSAQELRNEIGLLRSGDSVRIGYVRDGKRQTTTAKLGNLSASKTDEPSDIESLHPNLAGAQFSDLPKNDKRFSGLSGVLVVAVENGSPAAQRNLQADDVIIKVNRKTIKSLAELRRELKDHDTIGLTVVRDGRQLLIFVG